MPRLLRGMVRTAAVAGTATAVRNGVNRRQGQRWAQQDAAAYAAPPAPAEPAPPAPAAAPAAGPSTIDQLKELAELKSQGILTEAEFEAQKAKILAA